MVYVYSNSSSPSYSKKHLLTHVRMYTNFCHLIFITTNHDLYSFLTIQCLPVFALAILLDYAALCWLPLWSGVFIYFAQLLYARPRLYIVEVVLVFYLYYYNSCYYCSIKKSGVVSSL